MRKYDRNAVFNIVLKCFLFLAVFAGSFFLIRFLTGVSACIAAAVSLIPALSAVLVFSLLLRYTRFYYGYYDFTSGFLFGNKKGNVYCPCCDKHFDQFKDERFYADEKHFDPASFSVSRQDVICDCCRSSPRHRIIACWAEKNTGMLKGSEILYFAPELSMMLWFKRHGIHVVTADLFDRRADKKLDITSLELPDESEDIVFCNHVLEHVSDYSAALSELHRILREGGKLIISFPVDSNLDEVREDKNASAKERVKLFGQFDHLRIFGKDSKKILEKAGFEVETMDISDMPDEIVPVAGPSNYDTNMIFLCTKKPG